jgi:hypothetical protein
MWALDFMYDTLYYGRSFRVLNVIDESNREALAIKIDMRLPATCVARVMEQAREINEERIQSYNQDPPHAALGKLSNKLTTSRKIDFRGVYFLGGITLYFVFIVIVVLVCRFVLIFPFAYN